MYSRCILDRRKFLPRLRLAQERIDIVDARRAEMVLSSHVHESFLGVFLLALGAANALNAYVVWHG